MTKSRLTFSAFLLIFSTAVSFAKTTNLATGIYDNAKGSPILELLASARSTIFMEIYEMDDPKVITAIRDAMDRGVSVHIVKEPKPVGAACKVFEDTGARLKPRAKIKVSVKAGKTDSASCDDQKQLVDDVNGAGGEYVAFSKPELCSDGSTKCLEHGKAVIVDSKLALISSGNFNTTNLCDRDYSPKTCNRDYSYLTDDQDVVKSLSQVIKADIKGTAYDPADVLTGTAVDKLTVGPNSLDPLVQFIGSAQEKIIVENQYLKDPSINDALIKAAKSGVQVQVVIASSCSFGTPTANDVKKQTAIFKTFDQAGIETRMFTKNMRVNGISGYLHAKAIVVDDSKAWMGSVNGSTQAATLNREFGIFFDDAADVKSLAQTMTGDFDNPNGESWKDSLNCAENQ